MGAGDESVKIRIVTPLTAFENDIADVVRLFYGEGAATTYDEACDGMLVHVLRIL